MPEHKKVLRLADALIQQPPTNGNCRPADPPHPYSDDVCGIESQSTAHGDKHTSVQPYQASYRDTHHGGLEVRKMPPDFEIDFALRCDAPYDMLSEQEPLSLEHRDPLYEHLDEYVASEPDSDPPLELIEDGACSEVDSLPMIIAVIHCLTKALCM
jgi:hypothetical protein